MPRARLIGDSQVVFDCPGCGGWHGVYVKPGESKSVWTWNGSLDKPTFSPSILIHKQEPAGEYRGQPLCHSFVTDGRIQFLGDCTHALAGKTVDLPEMED